MIDVRDIMFVALAGAVSLAGQQIAAIQRATVDKYCTTCHSKELRTADLSPVSYTHLTLPTILRV